MSDGGKGSKSRPFFVKYEDFSANWDRIFSKPALKESDPQSGDTRVNQQGVTEEYRGGYWVPREYDNK